MTGPKVTETFNRQEVEERATEFDGGDKLTEIALFRGETAWNPLSTKGPLFGPAIVKYLMQPSGITVGLYELGRCVGMNQVRKAGQEYFEWLQCEAKLDDKRAVRCEDHKL